MLSHWKTSSTWTRGTIWKGAKREPAPKSETEGTFVVFPVEEDGNGWSAESSRKQREQVESERASPALALGGEEGAGGSSSISICHRSCYLLMSKKKRRDVLSEEVQIQSRRPREIKQGTRLAEKMQEDRGLKSE